MDMSRPLGRGRLTADPRVIDTAVVLTCLVITGLAVKGSWSALPQPMIAAAGVVGSAAQWFRRRWPLVATAIGAAAYVLSGNPGPLLVGLYAGAAHGPRRRVWAHGVMGWTGFVAWSWMDTGRPTVDDAAYAALAAGLVLAVGVYVAVRNALFTSLRERAEHAEAERLLRDQQARAAERTRIAREMHDVLAHKVSLIALHAGALELKADDDARLQQGATLIRVTAREALQELRDVIGVLHAVPGEGVTDAASRERGEPFADLMSLMRDSRRAGQHVELQDKAGPLPSATARVVYRVVQEGLTNARKHAPGASTAVSVIPGDGSVTVTVRNSAGAGEPMDLPRSGYGLVGLAERIRLVGGSLRSGPFGEDGTAGWELIAVVPWLDQNVEPQQVEVDAS